MTHAQAPSRTTTAALHGGVAVPVNGTGLNNNNRNNASHPRAGD